jgi:hypothetical protein
MNHQPLLFLLVIFSSSDLKHLKAKHKWEQAKRILSTHGLNQSRVLIVSKPG